MVYGRIHYKFAQLTHPRVLPFVWHGDNISVKQLLPFRFRIPSLESLYGWSRSFWVALQPVLDYVMVKLFAPQQTGIGLARNLGFQRR